MMSEQDLDRGTAETGNRDDRAWPLLGQVAGVGGSSATQHHYIHLKSELHAGPGPAGFKDSSGWGWRVAGEFMQNNSVLVCTH